MEHDELPRISIAFMRDWLYIRSKFAEAYVENTFKIAQANIRINGRDFDTLQPHEQDAEPFDETLDRQIWALASNRLQWHQKIAAQRRETPINLELTLQELFVENETLDAELNAEENDVSENLLDDPELNVDGQVVSQILAVTGELSQSLPSQQERSERSRLVEAEFKALKPWILRYAPI
ncbi:hypothetical protein B0H19DRAFT_1365533 [Mycena capillaripes]|nr:hypothetical protein B0H19DRAFT_1365533 [Mycena capillaripes]